MDATYAKGKSTEELDRHHGAILGLAEDLPLHIMGQDHAFAILDATGVDLILNFMSMGWTATEIASHVKVPSMPYAKWVSKRIKPDDLKIATRNFADALVTRAMYVLSHRHSSPQEGSAMKEFAKMARDLAACANPDELMPGKIIGANTQALSAVAINIDIGSGLSQGPTTSTAQSRPVATSLATIDGQTQPTPTGVGLLPNDAMPSPPLPATEPEYTGPTMGWIFGDTAPIPETSASGNPPTRERPNG